MRLVRAMLLAALTAVPAFAGPPEPVALAPIAHAEAALVVVSPDGTETVFAPADLETLPTYALTTTTPWREAPATFEGVLLADILGRTGLGDVAAIRVVAENDYAVTIPRAVWEASPLLVATRVDGAAHSRRARGPIQFVFDMAAYEASEVITESHWVWSAARIEAAD